MPLPRYHTTTTVRKKFKSASWSLDDLDDRCLQKIIGHVMRLSSLSEDESRLIDNGKTEKNLSLVSKRWYYLTQALVSTFGVHRIDMDKLLPKPNAAKAKGVSVHSSSIRQPGVLAQRNIESKVPNMQDGLHKDGTFNIRLFRAIRPKLLRYKHILIDGSLACGDFMKLIVALDASRVEQLRLNVKVEKDLTSPKYFSAIPERLHYIEKLMFIWNSCPRDDYSNAMTWTVFKRSTNLRTLEIHLNEENPAKISTGSVNRESIDKIAARYLKNIPDSHFIMLEKVVFNRSSLETHDGCNYTSLVRSIIMGEDSIKRVDTNDSMLIDSLIRSSSRICTRRKLRCLKFSNPIRNMDTLCELFSTANLGTKNLAVMIDNIEQLDALRNCLESFREVREAGAECQLVLHLKDQKLPDCENKIASLIYLSKNAEVNIIINAQQRVSIDCCHLMWSVGRALQSPDSPGKCLFKILLHNNVLKQISEITVPFGRNFQFKINSNREDLNRHREILKSLKRDCYHQFVKSVRDNLTT